MSGEDPREGRKTPVEGRRPAGGAPGPLPPPTPPPRLSPDPAKLSPPAAKAPLATPRPAAGINPFLDEAGVSPSSRVKKPKPPPAVISAGGVDMARAHASNVLPKANQESKTVDVPKVVVAVETDPRRVKTGPRMAHSGRIPDSNRSPAERTLESARPPAVEVSHPDGPSPWAAAQAEAVDKKALPSANLPSDRPAPAEDERRKGSPLWLRLAAVATLLLLAFAIVRRFVLQPAAREGAYGPVSSSVAIAPPLPDDPATTAAATAPSATSTPGAAPPSPPASTASAEPVASADSTASAEPAVEPRPPRHARAPPRPRRPSRRSSRCSSFRRRSPTSERRAALAQPTPSFERAPVNLHRWTCCGVLAAATLLGAPSPSLGQPPPAGTASSASADAEAAKWLSLGNKAFKEGKFDEAEKAYKQAFAVKKVYDIAGNLAMAEFAQGKTRDAAEHLAFALRSFPITGDPATRDQMQKTYDQSRASVSAIKVSGLPKGAQVSVDGKPAGEAPLLDDVFVEPGKHTVKATLDGYKEASTTVDAPKGKSTPVSLTLVALPKEVVTIKEQAPPAPKRSLVPTFVAGGVAVAGIATGLALVLVGTGKKSDANDLRSNILGDHKGCVSGSPNFDSARCPDLADQFSSAYTLQNAGTAVLVVGGVAAVGAVAWALWPAAKPGPAKVGGLSVQAAPQVGPGQGGLSLAGSF
ncbi:MAG: PEGA domain-containing protein [Byssovorax sp.]